MHQEQTAFENIVGKGEIARNEQFLLFPHCFLLNQISVSPFVHTFDIISLFAVDLEEPKIGISGKRLTTVFQQYFQCAYPCFPGVILTCTPHNILPSHWLLFHVIIVETMDSGERIMNPVAMTTINPRKVYWPSLESNQRPLPVLKSYTLPTELLGLAGSVQYDIDRQIPEKNPDLILCSNIEL